MPIHLQATDGSAVVQRVERDLIFNFNHSDGQQSPIIADVIQAARVQTTATSPPITEWNPQHLGIHRAISVASEYSSPTDDSLTHYVARRHDNDIRDILLSAANSNGRPLMTTVVGGSSTGKTRALYEAVSVVLPNWPLLRPASGQSLLDMLERGIPPSCVVWLDDIQNFLDDPQHGGRVARYLFELITTPNVAPFVVLATAWPEVITRMSENINSNKSFGESNEIAAIENLLRCSKVVHAEEDFSSAQPEHLQAASIADVRMKEALGSSGGIGAGLTQTLAGGGLLLDRLNGKASATAPAFTPAAIAVLTSAMELRRIGIPNPIPAWAIVESAHEYLPPNARIQPNNWVTAGIAEAAQAVRGVQALTPSTIDGKISPSPDGYELHDYLFEQHLRRHGNQPTLPVIWTTLIENSSELAPSTLAQVGAAAQDRGLFSFARSLLFASISLGVTTTSIETRIIRLVEQSKMPDHQKWLEEMTKAGNEPSRMKLIATLSFAQQITELERLHREGITGADMALADVLFEEGNAHELIRLSNENIDKLGEIAGERYVEFLIRRGEIQSLVEYCSQTPHLSSKLILGLYLPSAEPYSKNFFEPLELDRDRAIRIIDLLSRIGDIDALWTLTDSGLPFADYAAKAIVDKCVARHETSGLWELTLREFSCAYRPLIDHLKSIGDQASLAELSASGITIPPKERKSKYRDETTKRWIRKVLASGNIDKLREMANEGVVGAADRLQELLEGKSPNLQAYSAAHRKDWTELKLLARGGDRAAQNSLARHYEQRCDVTALTDLAAAGSPAAIDLLANLLAREKNFDLLKAQVHRGSRPATERLICLLAEKAGVSPQHAELNTDADLVRTHQG